MNPVTLQFDNSIPYAIYLLHSQHSSSYHIINTFLTLLFTSERQSSSIYVIVLSIFVRAFWVLSPSPPKNIQFSGMSSFPFTIWLPTSIQDIRHKPVLTTVCSTSVPFIINRLKYSLSIVFLRHSLRLEGSPVQQNACSPIKRSIYLPKK